VGLRAELDASKRSRRGEKKQKQNCWKRGPISADKALRNTEIQPTKHLSLGREGREGWGYDGVVIFGGKTFLRKSRDSI